jgi:hypothetical protein
MYKQLTQFNIKKQICRFKIWAGGSNDHFFKVASLCFEANLLTFSFPKPIATVLEDTRGPHRRTPDGDSQVSTFSEHPCL